MMDRFLPWSLRVRRTVSLVATMLAMPLASIVAQQTAARTGRIVGRILDARTGEGLTDAGVQIVGTTLGVASGVDGRFQVLDVPSGTVTIQVRRLGFTPKTVTGILLGGDATVEQNIAMEPATLQLQTQVVTADAERGTVSEALDRQRTATGIVNAVTAEQIAKSPDGDAAQAVRRVSGVTVQDGKYVFVRGLGERYTTTTLNGARVPSPEPERRVVPLDLFPSGLLQSITTTKTFTPDQPGDFSGAQVDIRTREFPARRQATYQLTTGLTAGATGNTVLVAPGVGGESFAAAGHARDLPPMLRQAGNFQHVTLDQAQKNQLVGQLRDAWMPLTGRGSPNRSMSVSVGGNDPMLFGHRIGYLASGTYSFTQDVKRDQVRALANRGTTPGSTVEIDRFAGSSGSTGVLWGGLLNLSTMLGSSSRLALNGSYNRTADNEARTERGSFENEGIEARIDRIQYVERAVRAVQLAAEHQLGARNTLEWALSSSAVRRDEPDRSEFVSAIERDATTGVETRRWLNTGNEGAVRTFSTLDEDAHEARADWRGELRALGREHSVKVGGLYRRTDRHADTRAYSISAPGAPTSVRELPPEQLFDGRFTTPTANVFELAPLSQGGSYAARDRLGAAFAMAEMGLTERFRLVGGARMERDRLSVDATSTLGTPVSTDRDWTDVLPSLALNVALTGHQNLRVSATRTVARPEYRELSPIKSRDVLNGDDVEGNPDLERTRIVNGDLRWEWYPDATEIVSVGVFAKRFDHPIERVYRAAGSGTRTVFFLNAESADNYGIELELRKGLAFLGAPFRPLSFFTNVTAMQSRIHLGDSTGASATNPSRRMVGQAPYVVNAGLTYSPGDGGRSATLLFNRVGERIDAAGDKPLPDVLALPRNVLDFSLRFPLVGGVAARFDARNLFDAPYTVMQGTVTRESYRVGRVFQLGLSWRS